MWIVLWLLLVCRCLNDVILVEQVLVLSGSCRPRCSKYGFSLNAVGGVVAGYMLLGQLVFLMVFSW